MADPPRIARRRRDAGMQRIRTKTFVRLSDAIAWLDSVRSGSTGYRAAAWLVLAGLAVASVYALHHQPVSIRDLNWIPVILIAGVVLPGLFFLNTLEYALCCKALGRAVSLADSLRLVLIGTAANFLPIPGSSLVRVVGMKSAGASYSQASAVVLAQYAVWLGLALLYAGVCAWTLSLSNLAAGLAAAGLGILAFGILGLRYLRFGLSALGLVLLLRAGMVVGEAVRIALAFAALGISASFAQVSTISASSVIGSAFGLVPAGLGFSEVGAAALGEAVGVGAASAFLVAVLGRAITIAVLLPVGAVLALRRTPSRRSLEEQGDIPQPARAV